MKRGVGGVSVLRASLVWGLAALFYFYDNLLQVSPSAMKPELSLIFAREAEQFGSLSAYCLYAYGLMQIPAGLLMDRFGPKRLLTLASLLCGLGSLVFGLALTLWQAKFGRVLIGMGAAFALVGCLNIASLWFSAKRFAFMTGLTVTVGFLGAVFGLSTVSKIVAWCDWRHSMYYGGAVGLLLALLLWTMMPNAPREITLKVAGFRFSTAKSFARVLLAFYRGLKQVCRQAQTWIAALYAGLMFVPTLAFGGLWGIPFLVEAHGFDRETAGLCVSFIYIGWVFGAPFWGWISDYYQRRKPPMMVATLLTLFLCIAIIYLQGLSLSLLAVLLFFLGFCSSGFIIAFAVVRETNTPEVAGTAIGFTNALNTLWGALAQPLIGKFLDMGTDPIIAANGEHIFSLVAYQQAFIALPVALVISIILLMFVKETFCKVSYKPAMLMG
ncbi:MAG: MFS transporter [Gammaproteobacteria bacterium]|nr:MFS transporter [Gammaproteobacteria bacterium]MBP9729301.1 MFS transporter [Gammaproteobacteria bacterium]